MSFTGASIQSSSSNALPIPHVTLERPTFPTNTDASGGLLLTFVNTPNITALNIPESLLDPALDLKIDLLRYVRGKTTKRGGPSGTRPDRSGYRHPANYVGGAQPTGGNDTHSGATNSVVGDRLSEWSVTSRNQVVQVDLSKYFIADSVDYFDGSTYVIEPMLLPCGNRSRHGRFPGSKFAYSKRYQPAYFAFRYSIADVEKGVGRITGPASKVIVCSHARHPFVYEATLSQVAGRASASINSGFNNQLLKCHFQTRLPA